MSGSATTESPSEHLDLHFRRTTDDSAEMAVDAGTTDALYRVTAPSTHYYIIYRVLFRILHTGVRPSRFGGISALTEGNGMLIQVFDDAGAEQVDYLDGEEIVDNSDFALIAGSDNEVITAAADDAVIVRWTIANSGNALLLKPGWYMQVTHRSDLEALTKFHMKAQGHRIPVDHMLGDPLA